MSRPNPTRVIEAGERNLAERIERERQRRGLSYEALAKAMTEVGCPIQGSAIYKIEKADPPRRITVDELVAFATVFETSAVDLLTPVDLLDKQRAQELLAAQEDATADAYKALTKVAECWVDVLELLPGDSDLFEYVLGHLERRGLTTNPHWTSFFMSAIDEAVERRGLRHIFAELGPDDLAEIRRRLDLEDEEVLRDRHR